MEDETFDTIYGSCKAENLRSDGTLVTQILEWTLANGDHAKMYIPCGDDDVRFFTFLLNSIFIYKEGERERVEIFIQIFHKNSLFLSYIINHT